MTTFAADVSYYQAPVDDSYPYDWFIFRACDGTFRDPNFAKNYAWAKKAARTGRIAGYTVYVVYRPGVDVLDVLRSLVGKPDSHVTVMVDVESWGGQIRGDHSPEITDLVVQIGIWLGSRRRVLAYANGGDFASIYPHRPSWLRLVVASYGSVQPTLRNMIGWQYSDGQERWPVPHGYPRSAKPFGRCDHNVFPGLTPAQLATELGVGVRDPAGDSPSGAGEHPIPTPIPKPVPKPAPVEVAAMAKIVVVDQAECKKKKLTWPGWFLTDGFRIEHISSKARLNALRKLGLSVQKISIATYRGLGGK